jgi:hypothetical protein
MQHRGDHHCIAGRRLPLAVSLNVSLRLVDTKKPPSGGFFRARRNYFFGASDAAAIGADAAPAATGAASEAAGAGAGAGAAAGAATGAGAGASTFFSPQAARATTATSAAKTRDLFISLSLKLKRKQFPEIVKSMQIKELPLIDQIKGLELFYLVFDYSPD